MSVRKSGLQPDGSYILIDEMENPYGSTTKDGEYEESLHPRDPDGRWTNSGDSKEIVITDSNRKVIQEEASQQRAQHLRTGERSNNRFNMTLVGDRVMGAYMIISQALQFPKEGETLVVTKNSDNTVAGLIGYQLKEDAMHVDMLAGVLKGEGSKLMDKVEKLAIAAGVPVKLDAFEDAVSFYKNRGYERMDAGPFHHPEGSFEAMAYRSYLAPMKKTFAKKAAVKEVDDVGPLCGDERATRVIKGGPGSGNFGHEGRPGEVGGSGAGGGQTNSPEFKAWFGDSKVVDADGKPLRMYHGTFEDFSEFIDTPRGEGFWPIGIWFTNNPSIADQYSGAQDKGAKIVPVYLSIKNPVPFGTDLKWAKANGYDGAISYTMTNGRVHPATVIAFSATQIKSAIGNRGTFDPRERDITKYDEDQLRDDRGRWTSGGSIKDFSPADQVRMKALKVPPAWTDIKLNPDTTAALQVIGHDAKGRSQYLYSAAHGEEAAAEKFSRLKDFHKQLPAIREQFTKDASGKVSDTQQAAAVVYLIDQTAFRIGSDTDTKTSHHAFGASTLEGQHVKVEGNKVTFSFTGKKGVRINKTVTDEKLAGLISAANPQAKQPIFDSSDAKVRDYFHSVAGKDFQIKDFRTWHGTRIALKAVKGMKIPKTAKDYKKMRKEVAEKVSKFLGNTPAVALSAYINPAVFKSWGTPATKAESDWDVMEEFFETHHYDVTGDWRGMPATEFDPDDNDQDEQALDDFMLVSKAEEEPALKYNPYHDEQGRFSSGSGIPGVGSTVPPRPGTAPIPEGHVRLYHQTHEENLLSIIDGGLTMEHAKGIEGPKAIYASETGFYGKLDPEKGFGGRPTLEFHVPKEKWQDPFVLQDVHVADIVAVHFPWHNRARYIEERPDLLAKALAGKFDNLKDDDYAAAVTYIKEKYKAHKGGPGSGNHGHRGRPGLVGGSDDDGEEEEFKKQQAARAAEDKYRAWTQIPEIADLVDVNVDRENTVGYYPPDSAEFWEGMLRAGQDAVQNRAEERGIKLPKHVFKFNPNHDERGRFATSPGLEPGPIDKRLVDYKPDRALSDPAKTVQLTAMLSKVEYVPYSKTPFFDAINKMQGTPDPMNIPVQAFLDARSKLFESLPVKSVPMDRLVVTQKMVNTDRVNEIVDDPKTGGSKPIFTVRYKGKTYILNGHHRVAAEVLAGHRFIDSHVLVLKRKYDPDQLRDPDGRWTDGGGAQFTSPEERDTSTWGEAKALMGKEAHVEAMKKARHIDDLLGLSGISQEMSFGDTKTWGSEISFVDTLKNPEYDLMRVSSAMKGWLGNQKGVGLFKEDKDGEQGMLEMEIPHMDLDELRGVLNESGVDFRTLVPTDTGVRIMTLALDESVVEKFSALAAQFNQRYTYVKGRGEIIDAETREEARERYRSIIEGPLGDGEKVRAAWDWVRSQRQYKFERALKEFLSKAEDDRILDPFQPFEESGDALMQMVSSLHTSRLSAYGFTAEAEVMNVDEYALSAQLDNRVCEVCALMHGRRFQVSAARSALDTILHIDNPEDLKTLQAWPDQDAQSVEEMANMTDEEIVSRNWMIPPFHPSCRCLLVHIGSVPRIKDMPSFLSSSQIAPEDYLSTIQGMREFGVSMSERELNFWNAEIATPLGDILAGLTGVDSKKLLDAVTDSGDIHGVLDSTSIGLSSLSVLIGTGIELELDRIMFGSKGTFKTSYSFDTINSRLLIDELDSEDLGVQGRTLAGAATVAERLGMAEMYVSSDVIDSVTMARAGFLPSQEDWNDIRAAMSVQLAAMDGLTLAQINKVEQLLADDNPLAMRELALYRTNAGRSVGQDLLDAVIWTGTLELDDNASMVLFDRTTKFSGDAMTYLSRRRHDPRIAALKGGPGSGFHGHAGRPGEIGGSSSGDFSASGLGEKTREGGDHMIDSQDKYSRNGVYIDTRRELHDKMLTKMIDRIPDTAQPTVYMMGGGPASGKTSTVEAGLVVLPGEDKAVYISADDFKEKLPEYNKLIKEGMEFDAAALMHEESSYLTDKALKHTPTKDVVYDGTGDGKWEKLANRVAEWRTQGRKVVANYMTLPTDLAVKIAQGRGEKTQRWVPEKVIRQTHRDVVGMFQKALNAKLMDELNLFDTRIKGEPRLVVSQKNGITTIHRQELYNEFLAKANETVLERYEQPQRKNK